MLNSKQWTGFLKNCLEYVGEPRVTYFCRLSGVNTSSSYNPSGSSKVPVDRKGNVTVPARASQKASEDSVCGRDGGQLCSDLKTLFIFTSVLDK